MIVVLGHNIYSPLGGDTRANYRAILDGRSAIAPHSRWDLPEPFCASLLDRDQVEADFREISTIPATNAAPTANAVSGGNTPAHGSAYTFFEKLAILSAARAFRDFGIDPSDADTRFVISTTKGNVELLDRPDGFEPERVELGQSALHIARFFGNPNTPLVVSNACISGVSAQIVASRLLRSGACRRIVVIGCDVLSAFIVSGFQSFKALSPEPCRPFDASRCGLNLGEAAATIVLGDLPDEPSKKGEPTDAPVWQLVDGAIRNDANHISGPSRTGEGSYQALERLLPQVTPGQLALVNAHGTATLYNDEMESIALERAGLSALPCGSLKSYFGHTLGTAGVLETLLSMQAVENGLLPGTKGFQRSGVSRPLNLSGENRPVQGCEFIKLLSGFGGCNAAILYRWKGGRSC